MPSEAKTAAVEKLTEVLQGASSVYLTDFTGMPVDMMSSLRRRCREADVEYRVVKDTLTKLAAQRAGMHQVLDYLEGPTGLALGRDDELAPARVLVDFAKEHKLPRIKVAFVEGRIFMEDGVKTLAVLPAREVLLGRFACGLRAPLAGLGGLLHQLMWKLVATLQAVGGALEEKGTAKAEATGEGVAGEDAGKPSESTGGESTGHGAGAAPSEAGAGAAEAPDSGTGEEGPSAGDAGSDSAKGPEAGEASEGEGGEGASPEEKA